EPVRQRVQRGGALPDDHARDRRGAEVAGGVFFFGPRHGRAAPRGGRGRQKKHHAHPEPSGRGRRERGIWGAGPPPTPSRGRAPPGARSSFAPTWPTSASASRTAIASSDAAAWSPPRPSSPVDRREGSWRRWIVSSGGSRRERRAWPSCTTAASDTWTPSIP